MRVLLLAGTGEARQIAQALAGEVDVLASLAGATRAPADLGVPTRIGGFGGAEGFRACLASEGIGAVLDATHPFATRITPRSAGLCAELGVPFAQVLRPGWVPVAGDDWTVIDHEEEAAPLIPAGARVFLATGRQGLHRFAGLAGRTLYCRQIDPPEVAFPYPPGDWVVGRPPFSVAEEVALFEALRIDWLVTKNAGGAASRSKLDAARLLRLPVAMIRRPEPGGWRILPSVTEALEWVRGRI